MVLRALTVIAFATVLASAAAASPRGGTPAVFVSAERASQLVGVNLDTGRVIARIRVPAGPHNVTSYSARYVLVTSPPAGAVTLVDAFSRRTLKVWRGFGYPHDVEVAEPYAYVTDEARGQLVVIDLPTRAIIARVPVGTRPHDVALSDVAYVTRGASTAELTIVRLNPRTAPRAIGRLAAGGSAHDISHQPDSTYAYVTYWNSGSVGAVDRAPREGRVRWKRRVGRLVHHVQFDYYHGRRLWVTDHGSGQVLALASRDGRVLRRLSGCAGAHHVGMVGQAWIAVACHDADALAVWSTRSWQRRLIRVGDGPHGVAEVVLP